MLEWRFVYIRQHIPVFIAFLSALRESTLIQRFNADKAKNYPASAIRGINSWSSARQLEDSVKKTHPFLSLRDSTIRHVNLL
jgi:hypothetical protein